MTDRARSGKPGGTDKEAAPAHASGEQGEGDRTAARAGEAAEEEIVPPAVEEAQDQAAVERIASDKNSAHAATGGTSGETPAPGVPPGTDGGSGDCEGNRPAAEGAATSARPGGSAMAPGRDKAMSRQW